MGDRAYSTPKTSVNWAFYSGPVDPTYVTGDPSFILDTGASCHISPHGSDFETKRDIPPLPISGIGSASVYATGIGTIRLSVAQGSSLYLDNVYYVPAATTRLISIADLTRDNNYTCVFKDGSCWIKDRNGNTIADGRVSARNLYILTLYTRDIQGSVPHQIGSTPHGAPLSYPYPPAAAPTVPTCPNCAFYSNYCSCRTWDMQQQRQQQPQQRQQTYPSSGVRPQSAAPPGNDTWGVAASFRTGNPEANNQYPRASTGPGWDTQQQRQQQLQWHQQNYLPSGVRLQSVASPGNDRGGAASFLADNPEANNQYPQASPGHPPGWDMQQQQQRQQQPQRHQQNYPSSGVRLQSVASPGNDTWGVAASFRTENPEANNQYPRVTPG